MSLLIVIHSLQFGIIERKQEIEVEAIKKKKVNRVYLEKKKIGINNFTVFLSFFFFVFVAAVLMFAKFWNNTNKKKKCKFCFLIKFKVYCKLLFFFFFCLIITAVFFFCVTDILEVCH